MLTLEEIRNVEFYRGRGYRADEVDDFIDECVETMEALVQENETMAQKMKVLADKVTEYRNDEDAIRSALLSAQRTGETILRDANARAEQILRDAEAKAAAIREDATSAIAEEHEELARAQKEVAAFKARLLSLYKEHLALLGMLPDVIPETPAPTEPETPVVVEPEEPEEAEMEDISSNDEEERPVSRFEGLKFGADYSIADDTDDEEDEDGVKIHRPFRRKK